MNWRSSLLISSSVLALAILIVSTRTAYSGIADALVRLQQSTPGTQQIGHVNVSGTSMASQFVGGGAGLTGVDADKLDGLDSTAFLTGVPNPLSLSGSQPGSFVMKGSNSSILNGSSGVLGQATGGTGTVYGGSFSTASTGGRGVYGYASALTGSAFGGYFDSDSSAGIGAYATSSGPYGVVGLSTINSGGAYGGYFSASSSNGRGVYGEAMANSGGTYGGWFESASGTGVRAISGGPYGVHASSSLASGAAYGGYFTSGSPDGTGVYALSSGLYGVRGSSTLASGVAYGGYFECSSTDGYGVSATSVGPYGVSGSSSVASGTSNGGYFSASGPATNRGVYGRGSTSATSFAYGGYFESYGTFGMGVFSTSEGAYGVQGKSTLASGVAFGGYFSSDSTSGRGVFGYASDTGAANTVYGVVGSASTTTLGYGVYALGDMGASGVKPFRIDHPLDPENKYLLHYSSESPFPQNFYNGNVTTDSEGYAWVELPDYFAEINTNFKYQLTVIGKSFAQAIISEEVEGNRFQIRTSEPNIKVSWEVKADRNDLRIRVHRPTDVREKYGAEKGKYQHPEYYGLGPERGMDYDPQSGNAGRNRR